MVNNSLYFNYITEFGGNSMKYYITQPLPN
jgi:hypothetical protein